MKGISHFVTGVAAASFFPWSVAAAADGNPLYFVLGGAFGLLPDTLDFKFYRFFYKHDIYVQPDPQNPDPQHIADQLAEAIKRAAAGEKKEIRVKLSTIRLGADYWQQYVVRFDPAKGEVMVRFGPVVNTGQVPVPGTEPDKRIGRAKLPCKMTQTYDATTRVDIFDGPTFAFASDGQGGVVLHFLPWHREWSHSFTLGALFALLAWPLLGWRASLVIMAGYSAHLCEDQLGFMGSNLFFPFTKKRSPGLHWMRSGDAWPNFMAVWLSCVLIFWNLYRYSPPSVYQFGFLQLILFSVVLPMGAFWLLMFFIKKRSPQTEVPIDMADEWGDAKMS